MTMWWVVDGAPSPQSRQLLRHSNRTASESRQLAGSAATVALQSVSLEAVVHPRQRSKSEQESSPAAIFCRHGFFDCFSSAKPQTQQLQRGKGSCAASCMAVWKQARGRTVCLALCRPGQPAHAAAVHVGRQVFLGYHRC